MWWEQPGHLEVHKNELLFAGKPVTDLSETHGTPAYFYNTGKVVAQFDKMQEAMEASSLGDVQVKFAVKANNNREIVRTIGEQGAGIDATSPDELKLARECGFSDRDVVFTGTALSDADLSFLAETDVLVNFDSVSSLRRFDARAGREVGLRINSGVGLGRSKKTTTGGKTATDSGSGDPASNGSGDDGAGDSLPVKFGIPHDDARLLEEAFETIEQNGYELVCIHHHVGSGWLGDQALKQEENYPTALENTLDVVERAEQRGHDVSILDLGGGYGVPHAKDEEPLVLRRLFDAISDRISESSVRFDVVYLEPGTYLVSDAGIFVTKVNTVESKNGYRFVGVDSGLNSFNSFAHYNYHHEVVNCCRVTSDGDRETVIVAGNNCESGDLFTEERSLPTTVEEGDYLALLNAGAYGAVFRSDFNLRDPADEIIIS